jgi:hypothetical protein
MSPLVDRAVDRDPSETAWRDGFQRQGHGAYKSMKSHWFKKSESYLVKS